MCFDRKCHSIVLLQCRGAVLLYMVNQTCGKSYYLPLPRYENISMFRRRKNQRMTQIKMFIHF